MKKMMEKSLNWLRNFIVNSIPPQAHYFAEMIPSEEAEEYEELIPTKHEQWAIDIFKRISLYLYVEVVVVGKGPEILINGREWKKKLPPHIEAYNMPPRHIKKALIKISPIVKKFYDEDGINLHLRFLGAVFNSWEEDFAEDAIWAKEREVFKKTVYWDHAG